MPVIPPMNLTPPATPWGRWMQNTVTDLQNTIALRAQGELNSNKMANSSISNIAKSLSNLQTSVNSLVASSVFAASQITSGVLDLARVPTIPQSQVSGTWDKGVATASGGQFNAGVTSVGARNQAITTGYSSLYADSSGVFGIPSSSGRYKQDVVPAGIDPKAIYRAEVVEFRYISDAEEFGDLAEIKTGGIAEQFSEAGLDAFVMRDSEGVISGIAYDQLALALMVTVQEQNQRLIVLEGKL